MTEREQERDAIVAWLREQAIVHRSKWAVSVDPKIQAAADAIERGAHLSTESDE